MIIKRNATSSRASGTPSSESKINPPSLSCPISPSPHHPTSSSSRPPLPPSSVVQCKLSQNPNRGKPILSRDPVIFCFATRLGLQTLLLQVQIKSVQKFLLPRILRVQKALDVFVEINSNSLLIMFQTKLQHPPLGLLFLAKRFQCLLACFQH